MAALEENKVKTHEISKEINAEEFLDAAPNLDDFKISQNYSNTVSGHNNQANKANNNRFVVPFGILIVLSTLYLTTSAFQRTNQSLTKTSELLNQVVDFPNILELNENKNYFEKDICSEVEIFVNKFKGTEYEKKDEGSSACERDTTTRIDAETETETTNDSIEQYKKRSTKAKNQKRKRINGKHLIKGQNGKRTNKSKATAKKLRKHFRQNLIESNKDENKKKSSTAEPIIYLFALVLIYLLFKAASDINQHYKSQAKGDKRLRRCSLQSYAQAHKQDRRASKDRQQEAFRQKHQMLEQRSQSLDRFTRSFQSDSHEKLEFLYNLRKQISIDEQIQGTLQNRKHLNTPLSTTELQTDRNNLGASQRLSLTDGNLSEIRRCSVPAVLPIILKPKRNSPPISITNRRTSVAGGGNTGQLGQLGGSFDATDLFQYSEAKRRVRMINRH